MFRMFGPATRNRRISAERHKAANVVGVINNRGAAETRSRRMCAFKATKTHAISKISRSSPAAAAAGNDV